MRNKIGIFTLLFALLPFVMVAQTKKVAVMETNKMTETVTTMQSQMVRGGLEAAVANALGYEGYDRSSFDAIMREQNFQRSGAVSDAQIKRLGEMAGVQYIIVSEASSDDGYFYVLVKMLDVETGKYGAAYDKLCGISAPEIKRACEELGGQLFGYSVEPVAPAPAPTPVVTPTPEPTPTPVPTPTHTEEEKYDVYKVINGFTVYGNQRTDYTDNAPALTVLTDAIGRWGEVRTGAISENGRGILIYGKNGYQYTGFGDAYSGFKDKIKKYHDDGERIGDVTFNSKGHYAIIRNAYGYGTGGLPQKFLDRLKERNEDKDSIFSVSLDENDNWAYVTKKYYLASNEGDNKFMQEASKKFGTIYSVCITLKGIVVCCKNGVYFKGVPSKVVDKIIGLLNKGKKPRVVKFTDSGTCLISDGVKTYTYYM